MLKFFPKKKNGERSEVESNCRDILHRLSVDIGERTLRKYENLQAARACILERFRALGHEPVENTYRVSGKEVSNIEVEIPGSRGPGEIIIIGAHYDTVEDTSGADDNASAVAGLLEICRLIAGGPHKKTARFVAFTLEEPPYFSTAEMGSMVYAERCRSRKEPVELMVCLEMLGYADKKYLQDMPPFNSGGGFPVKGDFLSVVSLPSSARYVYLWKNIYNEGSARPIYDLVGPASIPGLNFSDHGSFIKKGYPAIMISDTGFYRNKFYHTADDTYDTINFRFLSENILNIAGTIKKILDMDRLIEP